MEIEKIDKEVWMIMLMPLLFVVVEMIFVLAAIWIIVDRPVCHAVREDAPITDCDYHDGGWWQK